MNKYAATGDLFMDKALSYIDTNLADFKNIKTLNTNRFLPNSAVFSEYYNIANSRRTYLKLLSILNRVELLEVKPLIQKYYQEVVASISQKDSIYTELIDEIIKPALANLTISKAVYELSLRPVSDSVQVISFYQVSTKTADSDQVALDKISANAATQATGFLYRLAAKVAAMDIANTSDNRPNILENRSDSKHFIIY